MCGTGSSCSCYIWTWGQTGCGSHYFWLGMEAKLTAPYKELKNVNMKFVPFPVPGTMDIFGDKMLIIAWESTTGILISSKEITEHFKLYFDSLWKIAKT